MKVTSLSCRSGGVGRFVTSVTRFSSSSYCSLVGHAEQTSTSTDPVFGGMLVSGKLDVADEVSRVTRGGQLYISHRSLVQ